MSDILTQLVSFLIYIDNNRHMTYKLPKAALLLLVLTIVSSFRMTAPDIFIAPGDSCATITTTQIAGTVYEDWNFNGTMDEAPLNGFSNITVQVFSIDNVLEGSAITDVDGNYAISGLTVGEDYRVEFSLPTNIECWAEVTRDGPDSGTKIQFTQPGNCANLGIADPSDYCPSDNPQMIIACYEKGNAVYGATGNNGKSMIGMPYASSGPNAVGIDSIAAIYQTGTVWGSAWQPNNKKSFSPAFLKRYSGLGPEGLGGVYVMDYAGAAGGYETEFNLQGVTPANGGANIDLGSVNRTGVDNALANDNTSDSYDIDAFGKIGKVGFGDAEIGPDGNTLWMVNLAQLALITVDVSDPNTYPGTVNQYPISTYSNLPVCTNGVLRPWGLSFYEDKGYLGCVCTAENGGSAADMEAYILSFDPKTNFAFTTEISFPLDYIREKAVIFPNFGLDQDGDWHPWADDWASTGFNNTPPSEISHAQAIVSDIEFADDGSMIIGLADRFGFQMGYRDFIPVSGVTVETSVDAAGDIIKVCNIGGTWVLEGAAGCGNNDSTVNSELDNDGPNNNGEFFYADSFDDTNAAPTYNHSETFIGSLTVLKGTNEVVASHYDPVDGGGFSFDLGLLWHDVSTGARSDEFRIIPAGPSASKGNNLGDIETICKSSAIEVGNYVWCDSILNGRQDPGERGIDNIVVQLYDRNGLLVGQDTTTAGGYYYFNDLNVDTTGITVDGAGAASPVTGFSGQSFSTAYFIVFGEGQFAASEFTVDGETLGVTPFANVGLKDDIDSDVDGSNLTAGSLGARPDGLPFIPLTTLAQGGGDHKYDMGVTCVPYDFGDLPDLSAATGPGNYQTNLLFAGPFHEIIPGLSIGNTVDSEPDGQANSGATGDGVDEDGFSFPSSLSFSPGGTVSLPIDIINTTGIVANFEIWIDWNGDGDFNDPDEMVADLMDDGMGNFGSPNITINVPALAIENQNIGFRARLSHEDNMTPNGQATSGEVEDYFIAISCESPICLPVVVAKK